MIVRSTDLKFGIRPIDQLSSVCNSYNAAAWTGRMIGLRLMDSRGPSRLPVAYRICR